MSLRTMVMKLWSERGSSGPTVYYNTNSPEVAPEVTIQDVTPTMNGAISITLAAGMRVRVRALARVRGDSTVDSYLFLADHVPFEIAGGVTIPAATTVGSIVLIDVTISLIDGTDAIYSGFGVRPDGTVDSICMVRSTAPTSLSLRTGLAGAGTVDGSVEVKQFIVEVYQ